MNVVAVLSCGACGHPALRVQNSSRVLPFQASLIFVCEECSREQQLLVRLIDVGGVTQAAAERIGLRRKEAKCGEDSGYFRHVRTLREEACDACKAAHRKAEAERAARRPARRQAVAS